MGLGGCRGRRYVVYAFLGVEAGVVRSAVMPPGRLTLFGRPHWRGCGYACRGRPWAKFAPLYAADEVGEKADIVFIEFDHNVRVLVEALDAPYGGGDGSFS